MKPLEKELFLRDAIQVAPELLGKVVYRTLDSGKVLTGYITEVEAYPGVIDPASHGHKGVPTQRTASLFKEGGVTYVYRIHQVFCLNFVTGAKGDGQGVLIRSLDWVEGPGRLCRALEIDVTDNGIDITDSNSAIFVAEPAKKVQFEITTTTRIGISKAKEHLWRFVASGITGDNAK
jgi:DNA-3-methyladenine glycosylase